MSINSKKIDTETDTATVSLQPVVLSPKAQVLKVVYLSVCFLFTFTSYTGAQSIMSSLIPGNLGFWSLGCVYIAYTVGSLLISTSVVIALTPKWAMLLASVFYGAFVAANIKPMWGPLITMSVLAGLGASIIWASQGAYITAAAICHAKALGKPPRSSIGLMNGIFFCVFSLSVVIGNILNSLILSDDSVIALSSSDSEGGKSELSKSAQTLFFCFVAISVIGILGFVTVPSPVPQGYTIDYTELSKEDDSNEEKTKLKDNEESRKLSTFEKLMGAMVLLKDVKLLCFMLFLLFTGFMQSFAYGAFTRDYVKANLGIKMVGFVMAVFGLLDSVASAVAGKVCDRFGVRLAGAVGVVVTAVFLVAFGFFRDTAAGRSLPSAFAFACMLGVIDGSLYLVFASAAIAILFSDRTEAAFSVIKVFQSGGKALFFFLGSLIDLRAQLYIITATLVAGYALVLVMDGCVYPLRVQTGRKARRGRAEEVLGKCPEENDLLLGRKV